MLFGVGVLELFNDVPAALTHLGEALGIARHLGDATLLGDLHWPLAFIGFVTGSADMVREHLAAGWAQAEATGLPGLRSRYRVLRGYIALARGDLGGGRAELAAAYAETITADQPLYQCMILARLGGANLKLGLVAEAMADFVALRAAADDLGSSFYRTVATQRLGAEIAAASAAAAALLRDGMASAMREEHGWTVAEVVADVRAWLTAR